MISEGTTTSTHRILESLRAIVRDLRLAAVSYERQFGLSAAQLFVLRSLQDGSPLSLGEVAERTATDQSSVSVVVRKLEEKGLVHKRPSSEDGRRLEISLSPEGRRLSRKTPPAVQDLLLQRIAELQPSEQLLLAELLERLAPVEQEPRPMFFEEETPAKQKRPRRG